MKSIEELKWDSRGLIPAVVQDATSGEVLTVAYVEP
jgi:phosphoribosyl-AMP cyclohydrolase